MIDRNDKGWTQDLERWIRCHPRCAKPLPLGEIVARLVEDLQLEARWHDDG